MNVCITCAQVGLRFRFGVQAQGRPAELDDVPRGAPEGRLCHERASVAAGARTFLKERRKNR